MPTTKQASRVSCLAQAGFVAFGRGVQFISGSPLTETEQPFLTPSQCLLVSTNSNFGYLSLSALCLKTIILEENKRINIG